MYDNGYHVDKDRNKALDYYKLSAKQGYARAEFSLANAYLDGNGIERDINKAISLYTDAAKQNLPDAQYNLANIYEEGTIVQKDEKKALNLYTQAANQNFPIAQNNLGYMYANTYNDLEKAKYWFQRASENGYKDAEEALKQIESTSNSK